nr:ABC transporter ATP-binding protein [uncultured Agathobacter sp.]
MLQVNNLDKKLSGTENFHIDNVSLHIPGGYICGLIGENGAGKTTLIRILMGLYNTSGDVVINGHDMRTDEAAAKDDLAVVFDEGFFQQDMSLEQIGIFYGELYSRFDMSTYLEYLKRFELDKKKRYKKLSKGMKTKAQFAFALSHDAKLFLLDEPTAGLDRHFRDEFLKICADLVSDGSRSILISSHITEDLDRIADYIAYMQDGKLLFVLPKDELCDRFRLVTGEDYKCNLISKDAVVYKEKSEYSTSALVINKKCFLIDRELEVHTPDIREFMHYFVKGGKQNAEAVAKRYLSE